VHEPAALLLHVAPPRVRRSFEIQSNRAPARRPPQRSPRSREGPKGAAGRTPLSSPRAGCPNSQACTPGQGARASPPSWGLR
jgi:hypothetical protein